MYTFSLSLDVLFSLDVAIMLQINKIITNSIIHANTCVTKKSSYADVKKINQLPNLQQLHDWPTRLKTKWIRHYIVWTKKSHPFDVSNYSVENWQIFIITGNSIPGDICNHTIVMFSISPENCCHTTFKHTRKPILSHVSMNFDQITAVAYSAKSLVNKRFLEGETGRLISMEFSRWGSPRL